ncbi:TMEM43 family protein [Prosthecomicrobium sp. N25]|uniref:TMEM43 family protein n=1 Tax=Prosthecomicrobium sp. N25 TaxID=3129254 RepID=UPI0030778E4C
MTNDEWEKFLAERDDGDRYGKVMAKAEAEWKQMETWTSRIAGVIGFWLSVYFAWYVWNFVHTLLDFLGFGIVAEVIAFALTIVPYTVVLAWVAVDWLDRRYGGKR